jgi:hypothetical protein
MRFCLFEVADCDPKLEVSIWNLKGFSPQEVETFQVVLGPVSLIFDDPLESFGREAITWAVKRNRYAPTIGVTISLVTPSLGTQREPIAD